MHHAKTTALFFMSHDSVDIDIRSHTYAYIHILYYTILY